MQDAMVAPLTMNYNTGWGAVIDPIEDEDDTDDDVTLEEDDEDID